jgi:hypothetical protein
MANCILFQPTMGLAFLLFVLCPSARISNAFVVTPFSPSSSTESVVLLKATGMGKGMGMAANSKSKKNYSNKNKKKNGKGSNTAVFDVNASLMRLEKKYEELVLAGAKSLHNDDDIDEPTAEMVVTVRAAPNKSKTAATADWVPVAQLCLRPHAEVSSEWAQAAVSLYCRELSHAASLGTKAFSSVPRNDLQYAIEPTESFHKFVYDHVVLETQNNQKKSNGNVGDNDNLNGMTKAQARQVLELDEQEDDKSAIKKAYWKQSKKLHPDQLRDHSEEQLQQASLEYAKVQKAYEKLTSGVRTAGSSWYASLGGKDRNDFRPIELLGREDASAILERYRVESAVVGLDPELAQTFVIRNQAAGSVSSSSAASSPAL